MANRDREKRETEEWDLRKRITLASVWVAAWADDLIGNDTSLASTEDFTFQTQQCKLQYNGHVVNVLTGGICTDGEIDIETNVFRNTKS